MKIKNDAERIGMSQMQQNEKKDGQIYVNRNSTCVSDFISRFIWIIYEQMYTISHLQMKE